MRLQSAAWSLKGTAQCGFDATCDRTTTPGTGNDKPCFKHTPTQSHCSTRTVHVYICHSFHDSTSLRKQQEDGCCCPCRPLQYLYCTCLHLSQFPQLYKSSQATRGWLLLPLQYTAALLLYMHICHSFHNSTSICKQQEDVYWWLVPIPYMHICHNFHNSTSIRRQQEDSYRCPCRTRTVHVYLSQFPHSQATRGQLSLPLQSTAVLVLHMYICHSFHNNTSIRKQKEDGYRCPCIPAVASFPQRYQIPIFLQKTNPWK